jgi:2-dehydro-3-deoxyphosphogluconate aldolase / (4S)-4-hydroxy-2-oxoglutarate aldolase
VILDDLVAQRVLPVVVLASHAAADRLGDALVAGGLPVAEVTFRTPAAVPALRALAGRSDMLVGAGTVVTAAQVDASVEAGARFVVSPGLSARVVQRCHDLGVPAIPGIATATELIAALDLGVDLVKFFPAEASGGVAAIRALAAPFPGVRFVPTGGIGPGQLAAYLVEPSVAAVGGSWMVAPSLVEAGDYSAVTRLCREAITKIRRHGAS